MSELKVNKVTPRSGTTITIGDSGEHLALAGNIGLGGATPTTSGTGITFPATASASTDGNTLDDYEEGTWTPVVSAGSINGAGKAYVGRYTKIGRAVTITFGASSTDTNLQVTSFVGFSGLPFAPASTGTSTVTTEDIDVFSRQGFSYAEVTGFYLSACGNAGGTSVLTASLTYFI
jgi:hypothetical protein